MEVTFIRISPISGKKHAKTFDITPEQLHEWESSNRRKVQHIFPELPPEDREFIMTGITAEEWKELFGDSDE